MAAEIFDDKQCSLGEGPLWHPARQSLFWFDIDDKVLYEKPEDGARQDYRFDRTVSAAGLLEDPSKLVIASEHNLFLYDLTSGDEQIIHDLEADEPETRSNDGRVDPWGGFWIGTMSYRAEVGLGSIYRFYKGELRRLFDNITVSNAICFSHDRRHAYCTDSLGDKIIWSIELDADGWPAAERQTYVDLGGSLFGPDGAIIDTSGNLWNAQYNAARVAVYDPKGSMIAEHSLPTSLTTCPAFGGKDFTTLFVTTAGGHLTPDKTSKEPQAGMTFRIKNAGQGRPEYQVQL